ncbi:MAG TPA: hypothetical protein VHF69_14985, partial [Candidatus Synoicihabitans sp.]|nr:hypothetical protein [Candidatus Synoicihabitans sp.]
PLAVLYHTYFVQEAWLALFTWALLFTLLAWCERPRLWLALGTGLLVGLMQATKETSVLHYAALAAAVAAARFRTPKIDRAVWKRAASQLGAALAVALLVYVGFYSSFGAYWAGVAAGLETYVHQWRRSSDAAHSHPFLHYIQLLWPHRSGGVRWGEPALLAFALGGVALALRSSAPRALRAVATLTVALLLCYSAIPYKTPWLLLTPMIGLTLLAGVSLAALRHVSRWGPAVVLVATGVTLAQLVDRTRLALDRYPGDARNPYFYQQTPRGFIALVERLDELAAFDPRIAVVSPDDAWPLPWYLRGRDRVGYFATAPAALDAWDILIWDTRVPAPDAWPDGAVVELHGLRPNGLLQVVIRRELWEKLFATNQLDAHSAGAPSPVALNPP